MIYPQNFDQKTGFNQIKEILSGYCVSGMGKKHSDEIAFSSNYESVIHLLKKTREFLVILELGLPFPALDYYDLTKAIDRIQTPGTWLQTEELYDLYKSLNTIKECIIFFSLSSSQKLPLLKFQADQVADPSELIRQTDRILDEKGLIRDSASDELLKIRKEIRSKVASIEKTILQVLHHARQAGWAQADAEVTISDGRLVIPVTAANKRKINGIVHDESATGHTVYLEPGECVELNNQIRELEGAERREIIRILIQMSDLVRIERDALLHSFEFLGEMDFIRAKALFARDINATLPVVRNSPVILWREARHPLLYLSHRSKGKSIVPLDISLDNENRILIITGPNAGGKSVCLKTIGLLQYMLQSGLLVSMDADSETGFFENIFIDIGDEQSLENDLSTYSSHLLNMKFFIENSNPATLFLIDELGTGTDPSLGGALAEAVLEKLNTKGATGIVTTHYSNLKLLAGKMAGVLNGAMLFDMEKLVPIYKLAMGKPGSSFTFEIARRIGFPGDVIEIAKTKTGKTHLDFERQLQEVESEKSLLEKQLKEFQVADQLLASLIDKYERLKSDLENARSGILEKAREEARDLIDSSNRVIEKTIREIKESQAEKTITKNARDWITQFREEKLKAEKTEKIIQKSTSVIRPDARWKKGDRVSVEGRQGTGTILKIKGEHATVDFGGLKISIALSLIRESKGKEQKTGSKYSSIINELNEKAVNFKLTLDVRGKLADEALQQVQKYIDDAYLLRIKEVSILHGKGEGILRKAIRQFLAMTEEVQSFEDEHIERGGAGITKVFIR